MFASFDKQTLVLRKITEKKAFLAKSKHQIMYPDEKNMFIVSNHKKNGHYYENPSLSYLTDEL